VSFSEKGFLGLTGMQLAEYAQEVQQSEYQGLDSSNLARLLSREQDFDEEHLMYLLLWGIKLRVKDISSIAIRFLNRGAPWHGPQLEVLKALRGAPDLTRQHVDEIRAGNPKEFLGAIFPDVFRELIEQLRSNIPRQ